MRGSDPSKRCSCNVPILGYSRWKCEKKRNFEVQAPGPRMYHALYQSNPKSEGWKFKVPKVANVWRARVKFPRPPFFEYLSSQIITFHQPRFTWNKGISLTKPQFGVRSCEVAIIWPDLWLSMLCHLRHPWPLSSELRFLCKTPDTTSEKPCQIWRSNTNSSSPSSTHRFENNNLTRNGKNAKHIKTLHLRLHLRCI